MAFSLELDLSHHMEEMSLISCWAQAGEKLAGVNPTPKSELAGQEMASSISPLFGGWTVGPWTPTEIALVDKGWKLELCQGLSGHVSNTSVTLHIFSFKVRAKIAFTWSRKWVLHVLLNIT